MNIVRRALLISPDGMLGKAFHQLLVEVGNEFDVAQYPVFDITSPDSVERMLTTNHDVVINCSGWTDVDGAEEQESATFGVNAEGVALLAKRCRDLKALLVHFSTDYVFDGEATQPYVVNQPRCPVGVYSRSKSRGEELIEASGCQYLIIRTSWLYAPWGKNFVRTMAELSDTREELRVVNDQRGRPTSAQHLAATALQLIEAGAKGIFHVTDGGEATWYELAREVAGRTNPSCHVDPCTTAEFPRPAPRPAYSVLDLSHTEALLGNVMPHWRENVAEVLRQMHNKSEGQS